MKHIGTKEIKTERLTLRKLTPYDARPMYENWCCDPEVTKYLRWKAHDSIAVTEYVLDNWLDSYSDPDFYQWAIVPDEAGEPIGTISAFEYDETVNAITIGYCIGRAWWHRGYTSEALAAVIKFLFEEVGIDRIQSHHNPNNPNSGAVMRKCGMVYEGTVRKADFDNTGIVDYCIYSILKDEYLRK